MAINPTRTYTTDINSSAVKRGIRLKARSSLDLIWIFKIDGTALDLSDATSVTLTYSDTDALTKGDILGTVSNASEGEVTVEFTPTNTDVEAGVYGFDLKVNSASETLVSAWGELEIIARADEGVINSFPTTNNVSISSGTSRSILYTDHHKVFVYSGAGPYTLNLPSCSSAYLGTVFTIVNLTSHIVTLSCSGSDTINNSSAGGTMYSGQGGVNSSSASTLTIQMVTATSYHATAGTEAWTTT